MSDLITEEKIEKWRRKLLEKEENQKFKEGQTISPEPTQTITPVGQVRSQSSSTITPEKVEQWRQKLLAKEQSSAPAQSPFNLKVVKDAAIRAWEALDNPEHAIMAAWKKGAEKGLFLDGQNLPYHIMTDPDMRKAFWGGLTGKDKTTLGEITEKWLDDVMPDKPNMPYMYAKAGIKTAKEFLVDWWADPRAWMIGGLVQKFVGPAVAKLNKVLPKPIGRGVKIEPEAIEKVGETLAKPIYKEGAEAITKEVKSPAQIIAEGEIINKNFEPAFPGITEQTMKPKLQNIKPTEDLVVRVNETIAKSYDPLSRLPKGGMELTANISPYIEQYAKATGKPITAIFVDFNNMKSLNSMLRKMEYTDKVIADAMKYIDATSQGRISWMRLYDRGDELIGLTTIDKDEAMKLVKGINNSLSKMEFVTPTGQKVSNLNFAASVESEPAQTGSIMRLSKINQERVAKYKEAIKTNGIEPELATDVLENNEITFQGKKLEIKIPEEIAPNVGSKEFYRVRNYIVDELKISDDKLFDFNQKYGDILDGKLKAGGKVKDIIDDMKKIVESKAEPVSEPVTELKPTQETKPVAPEEIKPAIPPETEVKPTVQTPAREIKPIAIKEIEPGIIEVNPGADAWTDVWKKAPKTLQEQMAEHALKTDEPMKINIADLNAKPEELSAGINLLKKPKEWIDYLDKKIYGSIKTGSKKGWEKVKEITGIFDETIQLDAKLAEETGMPEVLRVDKPWWQSVKMVFGKAQGQEETIRMLGKAQGEIFRENRQFLESPMMKELFSFPKEVREDILAIGEGRAVPTKQFPSEALAWLNKYRKKMEGREALLMMHAKVWGWNLNDEILKARRFQMLMKLTGEPISTLEQMGFDPVYFSHYFDKYFKTWQGQYLRFPIRRWRPHFLKKSQGVEKYIKDIGLTVPVQEAEFTEYMVRYNLIDNVKKNFGKPIPETGELLPGYIKYEPAGHLRLFPVEVAPDKKIMAATKKGVEAFQVPVAVKKELDSFLGSGGGLEKIARMSYDKITNFWKVNVLALSPRWVINNFMGNLVLNTLGDISPESYSRALRVMFNANKYAKKEGVSLLTAYERLSIPNEVTTGIYEGEVGQAMRQLGMTRLKAKNTIETIGEFAGWLPNKIRNINSKVETFYRTAHYIDKIFSGYKKQEAINSVNEFLFNYTQMSFAERSIIRRIIPFWSWTKNITRFAFTYPVKHPLRTTGLVLGAKAATDYLRDNYGILIDWNKNEIKIPESDGKTYIVIKSRGANPFADILTPWDLFTPDGLTNFLSKTNPIIKGLVERATKTRISPFGAEDWTAPVVQKNEYGKEIRPLPSLPRHILLQFPWYQTFEQITKPYATYTATGEPIIGKKQPLYPRNEVFDLLRYLGANITEEDIKEMQRRQLLKEYNDLKYELEVKNYKRRSEIILKNYGEITEKIKEMKEKVKQERRPMGQREFEEELRKIRELREKLKNK